MRPLAKTPRQKVRGPSAPRECGIAPRSREGRESCTVQALREFEVGENDQWRQSAFGKDGDPTRLQGQRAFGGDGKDTRLQGHQATGVLQTVRGEAGSITRRAGG